MIPGDLLACALTSHFLLLAIVHGQTTIVRACRGAGFSALGKPPACAGGSCSYDRIRLTG